MKMIDKISEDLKLAMKSGDKLRLETLRSLRAALLEKQVEKRPQGGMTIDDEMSTLASASKKRKESITVFRQNNRDDLADQEEKELSIIQEYLPKQLSDQDVIEIIKKIVQASGFSSSKDFGKVMPAVMKELKGKADGKMIQDTVKHMLGT